MKRSKKQNPAEIQKWLETEYPAIKNRAKSEDADIFWGDESGCQNENNYLKGYAPIGQTPLLPVGNTKLRVNLISAVTNQGKMRFMFFRESMNAKILIEFMRRLIKDSGKKVFLILDNLKSHHAIIVKEWLEKHANKIEVFYLPPYAPEYNPDEYLNGSLKRKMTDAGSADSVDELESKARRVLKSMQNDSAKVAALFKAKHVAYAS